MYRKDYQVILRLSTIAFLSALGFVLMAYLRIDYPLGPWLKIELSDITVLIGYVLFSFPGGIAVAILKTALDLLVHGLTGVFGIGNITALISSLMYVLALFITSHILKLFKKGLGYRIIGYIFITVFVSLIMVFLNALFITPTYLSGKYTTCFDVEVRNQVVAALKGNNYFLSVFILYFPFNLIKASSICILYELIFNRLIFVLIRNNPKIGKYFFKKDKNEVNEDISDSNIEPKAEVKVEQESSTIPKPVKIETAEYDKKELNDNKRKDDNYVVYRKNMLSSEDKKTKPSITNREKRMLDELEPSTLSSASLDGIYKEDVNKILGQLEPSALKNIELPKLEDEKEEYLGINNENESVDILPGIDEVQSIPWEEKEKDIPPSTKKKKK